MSDVFPIATAEKIIAEKIQEWEEKRKKQKEQSKGDELNVYPFLAISRDFGCREEEIIPLLEKTLGWKVYGRNLLDHIAERDSLSRNFIETLDEHKQNLLDNWVNYLIRSGAVLQDEYFLKISRLMKVIIANESAIIVGRGENYILADKKEGLCIGLTADFQHRVKNIAALRNISEADAEKLVKDTDSERAKFLSHHFGSKHEKSDGLDVIFNTRNITPEMICKTVTLLLEEKKSAS